MRSLLSPVLLFLGLLVPILFGDLGAQASAEAEESTARFSASGREFQVEAELIEQLSAIGYLAASRQSRGSRGVVFHDPGKAAPGLNLLTSGHGPVAVLMGMEGKVLHEWRAEFSEIFPDHPRKNRGMEAHRNFWRDAVLFPNGDLLVIWELFGIFRLDRDSRVLWAVPEPAHHEVQLTETGDIAHLQAERKVIPGIENKPSVEDFIVLRDESGVELQRLAISDALRNANWLQLRKSFWKRAHDRSYGLDERSVHDPFHTNSLWLLTAAEATRLGPPFRAGDALISMAMLDTVAVVDMEKGVTRWSQQGPFGMQHSPRLLADGSIVLFNNFLSPKRSGVMTLDPRTRLVVRQYSGNSAEPLYSRRSGRVQVLENGNILVIETDGGRALELTQDGEVVWEFRSPYLVGEGDEKVAHLYSLKRVDESLTAWLSREAKGDQGK
ncbi:MAG TPA: hypothetical protein EYG54_06200 [Myxococcales bacterium]|nr:hypothetical protein [Myxococcales bacterium]